MTLTSSYLMHYSYEYDQQDMVDCVRVQARAAAVRDIFFMPKLVSDLQGHVDETCREKMMTNIPAVAP